jgi:hypothetical protein
MRILFPAALVVAMFAIPAPPQHLKAEIQAGHHRTQPSAPPYRFALGYKFGSANSLHFGFEAALTGRRDKSPKLTLDGDFALSRRA